MHFTTMVQHAAHKSRNKSVQFEKSHVGFENANAPGPSRDYATLHPMPSTRTSSLPIDHKENVIRHYRSMLDVDAPRLPLAKPLSYDELYPKPQELNFATASSTCSRTHGPAPGDSQASSRSSAHAAPGGISSLYLVLPKQLRC